MAKIIKLADGTDMKIDGKDVYESVLSGSVKTVNVERRRMTMRGTDETQDRDGDIVRTNGGDLENYRKNPVFLWAHDYRSVPLARAEKIVKKRDPIHMEFHLVYPSKVGLHPFADMILELYGEQIINASSIGFIPVKWDEIKREEQPKPGERVFWNPRDYTKWELLELSGCPVPCNPNALQNALTAKSFIDQPFDMIQRWLQGQAAPPRPKAEDDVLGELFGKSVELKDETKPFMIQVPEKFCVIEEEGEKDALFEIHKSVFGKKNKGTVTIGIHMIPTLNGVDVYNEPKLREVIEFAQGFLERGTQVILSADDDSTFELVPGKCGTWVKDETEQDVQFDEKDFISKEEVEKPMPSEHACRLKNPDGYDKFARKNCYKKHDGKCVDYIFGIKDSKSEVQAMRYKKDVWEASAARAHCKSHEGSFEAAKEAEVEEPKTVVTIDALDAKSFKEYMEKNLSLLEEIKVLVSKTVPPVIQVTGPDLATVPTDQGSKVTDETGKGVAETILDEAFNEKQQGKTVTLKLSNPNPPAQYDMKGVADALRDMQKAIASLKDGLERR